MNSRDRILTSISGKEPDRVPKGEFWLGDGLVQEILRFKGPVDFALRREAFKILRSDLVGVNCVPKVSAVEGSLPEGSLREVQRWRRHTDLFVFALVGGCFSDIMWAVGWEEFMAKIKGDPQALSSLSLAWCRFQAKIVQRCSDSGADAILIGDDLAYTQGLFISPKDMRNLFLPNLSVILEAAAKNGLPVFLHSDGNIKTLMEDIVALGITGLHPLDPTSGMDLGEVKSEYGSRLCLMGNVDTMLLGTSSLEKVRKATIEAMALGAPGGRYILGSSGGFLDTEVLAHNLITMYKTAEEMGKYPMPESHSKHGREHAASSHCAHDGEQ